MRKKVIRLILVLVLLIGVWGVTKPVPVGVGIMSEEMSVPAAQLLVDYSFTEPMGTVVRDQQIFDAILTMIAEAEEYILLDVFLFNDHLGTATSSYRSLSSELTDALIAKKASQPEIIIQLITDPINSSYGGYTPEHLQRLEAAGIEIIVTDLTQLRDSNPLYSMLWRAGLQYVPAIGGAWLPNLFDTRKPEVGIPAYLRSLNFKANHRKLIVADNPTPDGRSLRTLVTSMNPHDGSSAHSNVAIVIDGPFGHTVIASEAAVAQFSGVALVLPQFTSVDPEPTNTAVYAQLLTEQAIKESLLEQIALTQAGDSIKLAVFYFSDRDVIRALKAAGKRGVQIQLLLDPNKDAFGREKNGIPNRPVAHELVHKSRGAIQVRWCATQGEQCHSKLVMISFASGNTDLILGSANLTRRNLDNFNLETNVRIIASTTAPVIQQADLFFDTQWQNADGALYSHPYEVYAESNLLKTIWYRIGEFTGMSHY
jgi:phosphatidylserine/phosphatidylglycerophosphate/cardiolipin synthase-like enzyme